MSSLSSESVNNWFNVDNIRKASLAAGSKFFEPSTMRFFRSRVLKGVEMDSQGKCYFVTGEKSSFGDAPRRYTVRVWDPQDPAGMDTLGASFQHLTPRSARSAIRKHVKGAKK